MSSISPSFIAGVYGPSAKSSALSRILHFEAQMQRRMGIVRAQRYLRLHSYYMGTNLPPQNVEQPLSINYVKAVADKHVAFLWGDMKEHLIEWSVRPRDKEATPEDATAIKIRQYLDDLFEDNNANSLLWNGSLDGSIFGDSVFRLRFDQIEGRVIIDRILPEYFHARWDVTDPSKLLECIIAYPIDRTEAYETYGTNGNVGITYAQINPDYLPGLGVYWEHWTTHTYRKWIDDMLIEEGPNPYMWQDGNGNVFPGILPFVHIANMPAAGELWGYSDYEFLMALQDEINRRMADLGDIINNHAHPIIGLRKYHGDLEDLPVGPDAIWDLGIEGEVEVIEAKGNPMSRDYIDMLMSMFMDTASLPEIAFGRQGKSNGRAQTSATALQLILLPAVERARRKRIQWTLGLQQIARCAFFMQQVYDQDSLGFDPNVLRKYAITPTFADILPRDRIQDINEDVGLVVNGIRSTRRALEHLGEKDIEAQLRDIREDMQIRAQLELGGKNSDQGQGGSPMTGGPGAKAKPGMPAKDASDANKSLSSFES